MSCDDKVLLVLDELLGDGLVSIELHVITGALRTTALAMTSPCMRRIVDSYALYCARSAMAFKHALHRHAQTPLAKYRDFQRQTTGVAWPLLKQIHPALTVTADDVYLSTAVEFLPESCSTWIFARIAEMTTETG